MLFLQLLRPAHQRVPTSTSAVQERSLRAEIPAVHMVRTAGHLRQILLQKQTRSRLLIRSLAQTIRPRQMRAERTRWEFPLQMRETRAQTGPATSQNTSGMHRGQMRLLLPLACCS